MQTTWKMNILLEVFELVLPDDTGTGVRAEHLLKDIHHGRRTSPGGSHLVRYLNINVAYIICKI